MSFSNPTLSGTERTVQQAMLTYWGLFVVQGAIMIVLGVIAIVWPAVSTLAVDIYVGWVFLLSGITGLFTMFFALTVPAFLWSLLTAALSLFCGVLLLWHPVAGAVSLTLVLIAFFIAEGVFQIAAAISYREAFHGSWGWMVMSGVADLLLAGLIISGWPGSAGWALGVIVGVNLISSGLAIAMVAVAGRKLMNAIESSSS